MMVLWSACASPPAEAPATVVIVEHGTGELAGMVKVPAADVRLGAPEASTPQGPPAGAPHHPGGKGGPHGPPPGGAGGPPPGPHGGLPPKAEAPLPDFVCTDAEVGSGGCPALAHQALSTQRGAVSAFWIDTTEVTRAAYGAFLAATGYRPPHVEEAWAEAEWNWDGPTPPAGTEDHPVVLTNWYDAREYCAWRGARLPTEAEWRLAAHGPFDTETAYPWGDAYEEGRMNRGQLQEPFYDDADGFRTTSPVGSFPGGRSRYGADDLFGNAWEWVADVRVRSWDEVRFADAATRRDPRTPRLGLYAGALGFAYFADPRPNLAMSHNSFPVELRRKTSGFRCAKDVQP